MKKFLLGLIIGTSTLGIAVPLFAWAASSSASSESSSARANAFNPSQACVQALAARDQSELTNFDSIVLARKSALQARSAALSAAAAMADDVQRKDAVKKANDDFRTAMKTIMDQTKTAQQTNMDTLRTACGKGGKMFGGEGFGRGINGLGGSGMMGRRGEGRMHKGAFKGAEDTGVSSRSSSAR